MWVKNMNTHSYESFGISKREAEKIRAYAERYYFETERLGLIPEKRYMEYLNGYLNNLNKISKSKNSKLFFMLVLGRIIQIMEYYWKNKTSSESEAVKT